MLAWPLTYPLMHPVSIFETSQVEFTYGDGRTIYNGSTHQSLAFVEEHVTRSGPPTDFWSLLIHAPEIP
jgi:hypothetical protein